MQPHQICLELLLHCQVTVILAVLARQVTIILVGLLPGLSMYSLAADQHGPSKRACRPVMRLLLISLAIHWHFLMTVIRALSVHHM